jgi:hypothetical protein
MNPKNKAKGEVRRVMLAQDQGTAVTGDLAQHWFEVAKCGTYYDWRYGNFEITAQLLAELKANFDADVLALKVALDCNHEPEAGAMAWVAELDVRGNSLMARFAEWTPEGEKAVSDGKFRYFSIEFAPLELPAEDGVRVIDNVLKGIALTNRPVLKGMEGTFAERAPHETNQPAKAENRNKAMKNMVTRLCEALLKRPKLGKGDVETVKLMLADLPEDEQKEVKPVVDQVEAKADSDVAADAAAAEAAAKELSEKGDPAKALAEALPRLAKLEADNAKMLAEKAASEQAEVVASMMLSEKNLKGFPATAKDAVTALVKDVGTEAARKFAALVPQLTDASGKTVELGEGGAKATDAATSAADMALAEANAKASGKAVHVCLAEIYSERAAKAGAGK